MVFKRGQLSPSRLLQSMEVGNAREGIAIQKLTDEVQAEEDDDDDDGNGNAVLKQ